MTGSAKLSETETTQFTKIQIGLKNSFFFSLPWGFDPLLRPKVPPRYPWTDTPSVYVFSWQLTKIQILFVNFVHFFDIVIFFGSFLATFEPYTVPHTGSRVPIWT